MSPITYKFVMDSKGLITGVEMWQGREHITVSMAATGTHENGYRWNEVKDFLDNIDMPMLKDPAKVYERAIRAAME